MTEPAPHKSLWVALLVGGAGFAILGLRFSRGAIAAFLDRHVSLQMLDAGVDEQVLQLLMVPLASLVVVLSRLTLGLRMLGPFRPILIAVAFRETGVPFGAGFLVVVLVVVAAIRPRLTRSWLPSFGRLSLLLSVVVLVLVTAVLLGAALSWQPLQQLAFFPIVVLCLTADGFARALAREGLPSATARAATTVVVATLVNAAVGISDLQDILFQYPELVLVEVGAILLVATHLRFELLAWANPALRDGRPDDED